MQKIKITLRHDAGNFTVSVVAQNIAAAIVMVLEAEKCPETAIKKITQEEQLYKIVRVFRVSSRRQILQRGLPESEAQRITRSYKSVPNSMVTYERQ